MDEQHLPFLVAVAVLSFVLSFYGSAVGLVLGHLRLPLLIYCMPSTAAGMATNLAISGAGALTGAIRHARAGRISWRLLALMGLPSLGGAGLGALFLLRVESSWVRAVIGFFLVFTGIHLTCARLVAREPSQRFAGIRILSEVVLGLGLGFLAALTGLMLGSLRLPMMIRLLAIDPAEAVGTNMAVGCLTALFAAFALWPAGATLPWLPLLIIIPPTVLGGYLGARFTDHLRKDVLQRLIGATIVLLGLGMAAEGTWKAYRGSPASSSVTTLHPRVVPTSQRVPRLESLLPRHGVRVTRGEVGFRHQNHQGNEKDDQQQEHEECYQGSGSYQFRRCALVLADFCLMEHDWPPHIRSGDLAKRAMRRAEGARPPSGHTV